MYASLMGNFYFLALISYIRTTGVGKIVCTSGVVSSATNHIDPWIPPSQVEPDMPLYVAEVAYQAINDVSIDSISTPCVSGESDEAYFPTWVVNSTYSYNFLDMVLP